MESIISEYIVWVVDVTMVIYFSFYVLKDQLQVKPERLLLLAIFVSIMGSMISLWILDLLYRHFPLFMDFNTLILPPWIILGAFLLRWASKETMNRIMFVLLLSVQVLQFCQALTFFIYGLFFPALTSEVYYWGDIFGFGVPRLLITFLLSIFFYRLYQKLRILDLRKSMML